MSTIGSLPDKLRERIAKKKEILHKEPFFVLVWGSGKRGAVSYKKRQVVKKHLADRLGPNRVYMSEDKEFRDLVDKYGNQLAELLEAATVDAVVVLDSSIGPHTELALYGDVLQAKAVVFVAAKYRNSAGFGAVPYKSLKVEYYTPKEFADCHNIRAKANDFVHALLFRKVRDKVTKAR